MSVEKFNNQLDRLMGRHPRWRRGQAAFNLMKNMFPDKAEECRDTEFDPFYNDELTNKFIKKCLGEE